jgi:hypothetical protein
LPTTSGTVVVTSGAQTIEFADGSASTPSITNSGDTNTGIFFSAADTIDFAEGGTACGQFDSSANFKFNSGYGSVETAYGCRAWINFDGTGTPAIVGSGNISSITDNGAGDYTLNFTTSMPDANYTAVFGTTAGSTANTNYVQGIHVTGGSATGAATTKTTSALRILGRSTNGSSVDCVQNNIAIFR